MARVSVVIPTVNAGPRFAETLRAIRRQRLGEPVHILVVDSGSADGTVELSRDMGAQVITVPPQEFGHGRTRNLAIARCDAEYVALTVQDAIPADEHWLAALVEALDADPRAAGVYSRQLAPDGVGFIAREVTGYWHRHQDGRREQLLRDYDDFVRLPLHEKQYLCAFNNVSSAVRREVWLEHPFPEVRYAEDLAWGQEVLRAGYSILYEPASRVYHSHERSPDYEWRRAYAEGRTVGEIFEEPARLLSQEVAELLLQRWEALVSASADEYREDVLRLRDLGAAALDLRERYREVFCRRQGGATPALLVDLAALGVGGHRYLVGELRSRYAEQLWQQVAAERWGAGYRPGALAGLTRALGATRWHDAEAALRQLARNATSTRAWVERLGLQRVLVTRRVSVFGVLVRRIAAGAPTTEAERATLFDAFWDGLGRDHVRWAVLGAPYEGDDLVVADLAIDERCAAMTLSALAEGELSEDLYRDIRAYAASIVIGRRLGEAARYGAGALGGWLDARLGGGV